MGIAQGEAEAVLVFVLNHEHAHVYLYQECILSIFPLNRTFKKYAVKLCQTGSCLEDHRSNNNGLRDRVLCVIHQLLVCLHTYIYMYVLHGRMSSLRKHVMS